MNIPRGSSGGEGSPGLDALLQLPSGYGGRTSPGAAPEVAGAGEAEWRRRFLEAREALTSAGVAVEATKRELDNVALDTGSTQWNVAPPGGGGGDGGGSQSSSPLSFKLRQKLKQNREALDAAERALRELKIEANLAGVPKQWRGEDRKPADGALPEVGRPAN